MHLMSIPGPLSFVTQFKPLIVFEAVWYALDLCKVSMIGIFIFKRRFQVNMFIFVNVSKCIEMENKASCSLLQPLGI